MKQLSIITKAHFFRCDRNINLITLLQSARIVFLRTFYESFFPVFKEKHNQKMTKTKMNLYPSQDFESKLNFAVGIRLDCCGSKSTFLSFSQKNSFAQNPTEQKLQCSEYSVSIYFLLTLYNKMKIISTDKQCFSVYETFLIQYL